VEIAAAGEATLRTVRNIKGGRTWAHVTGHKTGAAE